MKDENELTEFERRTRAALQESAGSLEGATRSRLTQARHAALAQAARRPAWLDLRTLAPAGAVAVAALASVIVLNQGGESSLQNVAGGGAFDDIELLADTDALELSDEEDLEFIEWAAAMNDATTAGT